jgi:hypothetical protein
MKCDSMKVWTDNVELPWTMQILWWKRFRMPSFRYPHLNGEIHPYVTIVPWIECRKTNSPRRLASQEIKMDEKINF